MPTRRYSPYRYPPPRWRKRRAPPRRRSFSEWLTIVAAGGFLGTLAALNLGPALISSVGSSNAIASTAPSDDLTARFTFCHSGGGRNCVVDGDTFWFAGEKYRIADVDTPETHPPRCAEEARLGAAATDRLQAWLNAGAFRLDPIDRDTDRYGRKLRIVTRGGESVASVLISQGLARRWEGHRRPWC